MAAQREPLLVRAWSLCVQQACLHAASMPGGLASCARPHQPRASVAAATRCSLQPPTTPIWSSPNSDDLGSSISHSLITQLRRPASLARIRHLHHCRFVHCAFARTTPTMSQSQTGPMLINLPPPGSNPDTPSEMPYVHLSSIEPATFLPPPISHI